MTHHAWPCSPSSWLVHVLEQKAFWALGCPGCSFKPHTALPGLASSETCLRAPWPEHGQQSRRPGQIFSRHTLKRTPTEQECTHLRPHSAGVQTTLPPHAASGADLQPPHEQQCTHSRLHVRQVVPRNPVSQTEEERANVAGPRPGLSEPSITCLAAHRCGSALAVVASTPDASGAGAACQERRRGGGR